MMEPSVIYEDNHILVAVKPFGMPSQEDDSKDPDMLNWVKAYVKEKYAKPGDVFIGLVHRLDRVTGGLMVFARTSKAAARLSEEIRNHRLEKCYQTVIEGTMTQKKGLLEDYLIKDRKKNKVSIVRENQKKSQQSSKISKEEKFAKLYYDTIESIKELSLVDIQLETGRSHQIRVQFSSRGCPVYGDVKYGSTHSQPNIALWAYRIVFNHPTKKERLTFVAEVQDFLQGEYPWKLFQ